MIRANNMFNIYEEARRAMREYRWLESEKAGYDLGERAEREWARKFWLLFSRDCFVRHLLGEAFYAAYGEDCFGCLSEKLAVEKTLLERVVAMIRRGAENLDVLCWAMREHLPCDAVLRILKAVDINARRLPPPVGAIA